jgi:hypothetical protein
MCFEWLTAREASEMDLPITDPELRRRIEQRAFEIWKSEGFPSGRDWAHWVRAEAESLAGIEAGSAEDGQAPLAAKAEKAD